MRGRGAGAPAVVAVDLVGTTVHAATDDGDRLSIGLMLHADGDRLAVCAADESEADPAAPRPTPVALWDWIDRPALVVDAELWTVEEAFAAALSAVCGRTGAGPQTVLVLVVPATFGAVRRARVAAAAGPGWLLCDSGAAAVLGDRATAPAGRTTTIGAQVVVEAFGPDTVHALLVDDPWTCPAEGRCARPVAPPCDLAQARAAAGALLPAGAVTGVPLWSARSEDGSTGPAADPDRVLRGALRYAERSFGDEGTGSRGPAS